MVHVHGVSNKRKFNRMSRIGRIENIVKTQKPHVSLLERGILDTTGFLPYPTYPVHPVKFMFI